MYKCHYKYIKIKQNANLLFTDSDILAYETERDKVYEDFYEHKNLFDFMDYSKGSKCFDPVNKKVIGKINDEVKGKKKWICWIKVKDILFGSCGRWRN